MSSFLRLQMKGFSMGVAAPYIIEMLECELFVEELRQTPRPVQYNKETTDS
jgi:hypothetical protein